jgi:hypothetical protein
MLGIARLSDTGRTTVHADLVEPSVGESIRFDSDGATVLVWELQGLDGCEVITETGARRAVDGPEARVQLQRGEFLPQPETTLELKCARGLVGRYTRSLRSDPGDAARGMVDVAYAHLDGGELRRAVSEELPELLNPILRDELRTVSSRIEEHSSEWSIPGWLVDGVRLAPKSSVIVRGARMDLADGQFSVALDVDVDLHVEVLNRPIIAPKRRGTRTIELRIRDRFRPVRGVFSLEDWPELRVKDVDLRGEYCERFDRDVFLNVCNRIVDEVYERLEEVIARELRDSAAGAMRSLNLEALITDAMRNWAARIELSHVFDSVMEGAKFELLESKQDEAGLHLRLGANADWFDEVAGHPVAGLNQPLVLEDTGSTLDIAVRLGLVNRLLNELFDRPVDEVIAMLRPAGETYGDVETIDTMEEFLSVSEGSSKEGTKEHQFFSLLELASMQVNREARLAPTVWADEQGELTLYTGQSALLEGHEDGLQILVSAHESVELVEEEGFYHLSGLGDDVARTFALEPRRTNDSDRAKRAENRARAAIMLFYGASLMQARPEERERLSPALRLSRWLSQFDGAPLFPSRFETPTTAFSVDELTFRHTSQAIRFRASILEEGSD